MHKRNKMHGSNLLPLNVPDIVVYLLLTETFTYVKINENFNEISQNLFRLFNMRFFNHQKQITYTF